MERDFSKFAEEYVYQLELKRASKNGLAPPIKINTSKNNGIVNCGYDIKSEDRHIEVKSFTKTKTYKDLTANQTEVLRADPLYYVYVVEYNELNPDQPIVVPIPQRDLLEMGKVKEFIRLNRISNQEKRETWLSLLS